MTVVSKRSRLQRKFVNQMRQMGDVPWPARRFRYPATVAAVPVGRSCERLVTLRWERRGRLLGYVRAPQPRPVVCGAPLELVPFKRGLVECPACRWRGKRERLEARIAQPPRTVEVYARWYGRRARSAAARMFRRRSST